MKAICFLGLPKPMRIYPVHYVDKVISCKSYWIRMGNQNRRRHLLNQKSYDEIRRKKILLDSTNISKPVAGRKEVDMVVTDKRPEVEIYLKTAYADIPIETKGLPLSDSNRKGAL